MGIFDRFRKDEVAGATAQVIALGARFAEACKSDARVYKRVYPQSQSSEISACADLLGIVSGAPDILHLHCDVTPDGGIADASQNRISGAELIDRCVAANVKLLWIASNNAGEAYTRAFGARGQKINLVLTLDRRGPSFALFLDNLLTRMAGGETLPAAWNALCPQGTRGVHPDAPDCIFRAGRGGVVLRS